MFLFFYYCNPLLFFRFWVGFRSREGPKRHWYGKEAISIKLESKMHAYVSKCRHRWQTIQRTGVYRPTTQKDGTLPFGIPFRCGNCAGWAWLRVRPVRRPWILSRTLSNLPYKFGFCSNSGFMLILSAVSGLVSWIRSLPCWLIGILQTGFWFPVDWGKDSLITLSFHSLFKNIFLKVIGCGVPQFVASLSANSNRLGSISCVLCWQLSKLRCKMLLFWKHW